MAGKGRGSVRGEAGKRQAFARRVERARVALLEATDDRAFARAAFRLMLATVPGDHAEAMFHCAPPPRWGAWLASNGGTMSPEMIREISAVHSGMAVLQDNPGIKVIPTKGALPPEEELVETPFYRLCMLPFGWRHGVALVFWQSVSPPVLHCIFCIHRTAAQGDFSDSEIAAIAALHPEIDRARRRVVRLEEKRCAFNGLQHFVRDLPVPAVLLNGQFELLFHNREGVECCARWMHGDAARALKVRYQLPPALRAGCMAMKRKWSVDRGCRACVPGSYKQTVRHPSAPGLAARIDFIESGLMCEPNFLIVFEHAAWREPKAARERRPALAELSKLTPRQREIATLAGEAKSNAEIATALGCSIATVKNGLYAAFRKTGVASRTQLARALMDA